MDDVRRPERDVRWFERPASKQYPQTFTHTHTHKDASRYQKSSPFLHRFFCICPVACGSESMYWKVESLSSKPVGCTNTHTYIHTCPHAQDKLSCNNTHKTHKRLHKHSEIRIASHLYGDSGSLGLPRGSLSWTNRFTCPWSERCRNEWVCARVCVCVCVCV